MASRRRKKAKAEEYALLCLRLEHYDVHINAGINPDAYSPELAWNLDDHDSVYEFGINTTITAKLIYPDDRIGDTYDLTFYAKDTPSRNLIATLRDLHERDKDGVPQYRNYRQKQVPIYSPPKGLCHLDKIRGEPRWNAWVQVSRHFANTMLTMLGQQKALFLVLHERKDGRMRWVKSVSLQTNDPTDE